MQDFYSQSPFLRPERKHIKPVFLPFAGCRVKCVFCAQNHQTGKKSMNLNDIAAGMRKMLEDAFEEESEPFELAFYGGTFTLLSAECQEKLLALGHEYVKKGVVSNMRCSTRPDAIDTESLSRLKKYGLTTIELGVQSFNSKALESSLRGYTRETALNACLKIKEAGMNLIVQLMPGMPGVGPEEFRKDVETVVSLLPHAVRLYPCLVIEDTALAVLWEKGHFTPWNLENTVKRLGQALLILWEANIPAIRIGLAPEASLIPKILAGPWHPSLGSQVQAEAVCLWLEKKIKHLPGRLVSLNIPRRLQGFFWGEQGNLKARYENLGLTPENTLFWQWPLVRIRTIKTGTENGEKESSPHKP